MKYKCTMPEWAEEMTFCPLRDLEREAFVELYSEKDACEECEWAKPDDED